MNDFIYNFAKDASIFEKGVFLMIAGIGFVFMVQVIFYLIVKLWPGRPKSDKS